MIKSRYGGKTHIIVLVFGLFTNIIVTLSLLLGGTAVLTGLVQVIVYFVTKTTKENIFNSRAARIVAALQPGCEEMERE